MEIQKMYAVEVNAVGGWTRHSEHTSYRDAVNQADLVHGRIVVAATELSDKAAHRHAVRNQGFQGDYADWQRLEDQERDEYEAGAGC